MFGAFRLTKSADIDKYGYSGYGIGFDRRGSFSFTGGRFGINVIISEVDMSSAIHVDNKKGHSNSWKRSNTRIRTYTDCRKKCIQLILQWQERNCLGLHYNGANSYLFVNGIEIIKFKAKDPEIVATPLCLGNISKDWLVDNMKRTGFNGYVYDFSVDYDVVAVDDILDIYNYLMKKTI